MSRRVRFYPMRFLYLVAVCVIAYLALHSLLAPLFVVLGSLEIEVAR